MFYTKYTLLTEKIFRWKKRFTLKNVFTKKNFFYGEKYKWQCKKYISHLESIYLTYTENVCATNEI